MRGRYVRRSDKQRIAEEHFHVYGPSVPDFGPSWNVAPQTFRPIVRLNRDTREREIVMMRWGLIPFSITVGEVRVSQLAVAKYAIWGQIRKASNIHKLVLLAADSSKTKGDGKESRQSRSFEHKRLKPVRLGRRPSLGHFSSGSVLIVAKVGGDA